MHPATTLGSGALPAALVTLVSCAALLGCGGNSKPGSREALRSLPSGAEAAGGSAVPSEAQSAATGDIPDNQVFLVYRDRRAGYAVRYPEGWARRGSLADVTFQNNANVIRVAVVRHAPESASEVAAGVAQLARTDSSIAATAPRALTVSGQPVFEVTYRRLSAANPVTGKRLPLTIDRYVYAHAGKVAVLDLATPVGVDNVDAYRMISRTFRWL